MIIQPFPLFQEPPSLKLISLVKKLDLIAEKNSPILNLNKNFNEQLFQIKKAKKEATGDSKNFYSLNLYHKILIKIIEIIGEKNQILKNNPVTESDKIKYHGIISDLNLYYKKYFDKYRKIPSSTTYIQLIKNGLLPFLAASRLPRPDEIAEKKMLADAGYCMMTEVKKWLETPVLNANQSFSSLIQEQVDQFLKWAEEHPRTASYLASDIALTCSVLMEKQASEKILISINAMVFTKLFLESLGQCPEEKQETFKKIENEEMLKFRALADFVTYCPMLATGYTLTKKSLTGECPSIFSLGLTVIKEAGVTLAAQQITRLIPEGQEKLAKLVIDILRGQKLQDIIADQRNLALAQMAGSLGALFKKKHSFSRMLKINWETIIEANGIEKLERIFVQLILPALAISIFVTGLVLGFKGTLLIASAATLSILPPFILLVLANYLTDSINCGMGLAVKNKVLKKIAKQETRDELLRLHLFLLTNDQKKREIANEAKLYRRDLEAKYALPVLPKNHAEKKAALKPQSIKCLNQIKTKYLQKLKKQLVLKNGKIKPSDLITLFNHVVDLKKIRERLKLPAAQTQDKDTLIFSLAEELMEGWLQTQLEQAFKEKFLDIYQNGAPLQIHENADDYLKKRLKREFKKNSNLTKLQSKDAIMEALRSRDIL